MQKKSTVTITEIAKESGVSIATVSRVLNGNVPVSETKRKHVEEVIKKYNFIPNELARSLIRKETKTLGVIIPDISNPYFSSMFLEIERYALEAGYSLFLCNTLFGGSSHDIRNTKEEAYFFQLMIDKKVDGVLIMGGQVDLVTIEDSYKEALKQLSSQLPVVVIGRKINDVDCIFIQNETGSGVTTALNYLYMLGHRRIAFVGGQEKVTITEIRLQAYKDALTSLNLTPDNRLISLSDYYAQDGYTAITSLIDRHISFTAFLAINDAVALGAIRALTDRGYKIPEDIALISCDQFQTSDYQIPRLTGINYHNEILAHTAISSLLNLIHNIEVPSYVTRSPELVIRESCGTQLGLRKLNSL